MRSAWLRSVLLVLVVLLAVRRASACIWDSDTLAAEAEGLPGVLDILTGRFDRMPPAYFEARLARAEKAVAADPADLGAHDDAGVACDRLGRHDDALRWMERKDERLRAMGDAAPREHRYRLLANRGTFRAHRWFAAGADRARADELRAARDEIAAAIEIEPNAHFGRERYQLAAMTFFADPPAAPDDRGSSEARDFLGLERLGLHAQRENARLADAGFGDAIQGLCGLVVLGAAWESIDVFHAIANAAQVDGRSSVAYVARLRIDELLGAGRRSFDPSLPADADALRRLIVSNRLLMEDRAAAIRTWYADARAGADRWVAARRSFAEERLREGRAPDNVPALWEGFDASAAAAGVPEEPPIAPGELAIPGLGRWAAPQPALIIAVAAGTIVVLAAAYRLLDRRQRAA